MQHTAMLMMLALARTLFSQKRNRALAFTQRMRGRPNNWAMGPADYITSKLIKLLL
jgi:hypothetical protein